MKIRHKCFFSVKQDYSRCRPMSGSISPNIKYCYQARHPQCNCYLCSWVKSRRVWALSLYRESWDCFQVLHFGQYQITNHRGNDMHFLHFTQAHSHVNYHMQSVLQYVHKLCVCLEGWIPFDASCSPQCLWSNIFFLCPYSVACILFRFAANVEIVIVVVYCQFWK